MIGDPYVTAAQLKTYLGIADTADDTAITDACASISEEIENYCHRQFNDAGSATARVFEPSSLYTLDVHDFSTDTGLVVKYDSGGDGTYATTVAATSYQLRPLNGIVDGRTGWPYWQIQAANGYCWPTCWDIAPIQVTARWGWTTVPKAVVQAAYILANETFGLRGARFGVASYGEWGPIRVVKDSPMAMRKLDPYVRDKVLVG